MAAPPTQPLLAVRDRRIDVVVVVVLTVVAATLRAGELGPSSLWLDDAWVALASRAELGELRTVGATAPGFAVILRAVTAVIGASSTALQLVPFLSGVVGPATVFVVARRCHLDRPAAAVAAAVLLTSPVGVTYATRVKPYALDTLLILVVVAIAWQVLVDPSNGRRAGRLAVAAIAALVVSGTTALAIGPILAVLVFAALRSPVGAPALRAAGCVGAFGALWWLAVLRPASGPGLRVYWASYYPSRADGPTGVLVELGRLLVELMRGFTVVAPGPAVMVFVGCTAVVVVRRPLLGALLAGPVVATAAAATLRMAPFGGGRTDSHLYGPLALLVALGLHEGAHLLRRAMPRALPPAGVLGVTVSVVAALTLAARPPMPYPAENVRPLVVALEEQAAEGDVVLVYSATRWAYALYTEGPVALIADPSSLNGFDAVPGNPAVTVLEPHRTDPSSHAPAVATAVAGRSRVWLLSSHETADITAVEDALSASGFERRTSTEREGAMLTRWDRPVPTK